MEFTKSTGSIGEVKAFRDLSETSRSLLVRGLRYVECARLAPVLSKGQRVSGADVVVSGKLRVFTRSPDGNEATLYVIDRHETCVPAKGRIRTSRGQIVIVDSVRLAAEVTRRTRPRPRKRASALRAATKQIMSP